MGQQFRVAFRATFCNMLLQLATRSLRRRRNLTTGLKLDIKREFDGVTKIFFLSFQDLLVFPEQQDPQLHPQCPAPAQSCALTHASDPARRHVAVAEFLKTSCV